MRPVPRSPGARVSLLLPPLAAGDTAADAKPAA